MPSMLLVLPEDCAPSAPEFDYRIEPDARQVELQGRALASLLPAAARQGVALVLPARAVSWHALRLPQRVAQSLLGPRADTARVRAVLGGALEEQLLDDAQQLHFAVFAAPSPPDAGAADAGQSLWVAVCRRDWLAAGLRALEAAGIPVTHIVAECEPASTAQEASITWTGDSDAAQLIVATHQGVCVLPVGDAALHWVRAHAGATVLAEPGAVALAESCLGVPVEMQSPAQRQFQAVQGRYNLAQMEFSAARKDRWAKALGAQMQTLLHARNWRPVRWGLVGLLCVQVLGLNAIAWQEKNQMAAQRQALRTSLLASFPHITVVVDPVLQMQREVDVLARARGVASGVDLAQVLAVSARHTAQPWSAIALEGKQVRLESASLQDMDLSALNAALAPMALSARSQGTQLIVESRGMQ